MNLNWFVGFVEGEGNFTISFKIRHGYVYPWAYFQISQAEREILGKIQYFLSPYKIYASINRLQNGNWILQVMDRSSIHRLAKLLSSVEWHSQKGSSFQMWKRGIEIIKKPNSVASLKKVAGIAEKINPSAKKGRPRKLTPQFIEETCFSNNGKVMLVKSRGY